MVAEEGNLRRAAERLFASQPAVSGHIKALEEELGLVLFERTRHGMLLTPDGERIHEIARQMLENAQELEGTARSIREGVAGVLRVGVINEGWQLRLDEIVAALDGSCSGLQLDFVCGTSGPILEGIRNESLDIGYIELQPAESDVTLMHLMYSEPVIAYPAHWAPELQEDDWSVLIEKPWAFVSEGCSYYQTIQKAVAERGLKLDWRYRADSERVGANMVTSGMAVSLVSRALIEPYVAEGKVCLWPHFTPRLSRSLAFLTRRGSERAIQAYVQAVVDIMLKETEAVP